MDFQVYIVLLLFSISLLHNHVHAEGVKSSCESPATRMGDTGSVTCYFSVDLKQSSKSFRLYRYSMDPTNIRTRDEPVIVLDCYWLIVGDMQCEPLAPGYEFNGTVSNQVRVTIPKVLPDFQGKYECRAEPSYPRDIKDCVFLIKSFPEPTGGQTGDAAFPEPTGGQTGDAESDKDSSKTVGIAVGVVVAILLAAVAIVLVVFRKRFKDRLSCCGRQTTRDRSPAEQTPGETGTPLLASHAKEQSTVTGLPEGHRSTVTEPIERAQLEEERKQLERRQTQVENEKLAVEKQKAEADLQRKTAETKMAETELEIGQAMARLEEERKQLDRRQTQVEKEGLAVEKQKAEAEKERERQRAEAEIERKTVEKTKAKAELEKKAAEKERVNAELERKALEEERVRLEKEREKEEERWEALKRQVQAAGGYRMLLVGVTGTGKSSTHNTILGETKFHASLSSPSMTETCKLERGQCLGRTVEIMDTPGLFHTHRTHEDVVKEIVRGVAEMSRGFHVVLWLVQCNKKYTLMDFDAYKMFKTVFDKDVTKHMIVLFTMADSLDTVTLEKRLEQAPQNLQELLRECDNRYIPFSNKAKGTANVTQLENLFSVIDKLLAQTGAKILRQTLNVREAIR